MEAISQAAAEITAELPDGSVDVRLNGRELDFVVEIAPPAADARRRPRRRRRRRAEEEEGDLARITLRIPESVKARAEEKAAAAGHSLNTWLVNVVRAATSEHAINVDIDLASVPFVGTTRSPATQAGQQPPHDRLALTDRDLTGLTPPPHSGPAHAGPVGRAHPRRHHEQRATTSTPPSRSSCTSRTAAAAST